MKAIIIIANKKPVVFNVEDNAWIKFLTDSFLLTIASTKVEKEPIPAASVGLNQPKYIPPITIKNISIIKIVDFREANLSDQETNPSSSGALEGRIRTYIYIVNK